MYYHHIITVVHERWPQILKNVAIFFGLEFFQLLPSTSLHMIQTTAQYTIMCLVMSLP